MDWWQEGGWLAVYIPGRGFLPGSLLLGLPDCWESANTQKEGPGISSKRRQQRLAQSEIFSCQRWLFPAKVKSYNLKNYATMQTTLFLFFLIVTCNTFVGARSHLLRERVKVFSPLFFLICFSRKVHPLHNEQVIFVWTGLSLMGEQTEAKALRLTRTNL